MNEYLKDMSKEELKILLNKNKNNKSRWQYLEREFKTKFKIPKNLCNNCIDVLDRIGYTNNLIYKDESTNILTKLPEEIKHTCYSEKGERVSYDYLSVGIVTEVLDYYHAKYNEEEILSTYDLDKNNYINIKTKLNIILYNRYWKK